MTFNGTQKIILRFVQPPTLYMKHAIYINIHVFTNKRRCYLALWRANVSWVLHGSVFSLSHVPIPLGLFPNSGEHSRNHPCDISLQIFIRMSSKQTSPPFWSSYEQQPSELGTPSVLPTSISPNSCGSLSPTCRPSLITQQWCPRPNPILLLLLILIINSCQFWVFIFIYLVFKILT